MAGVRQRLRDYDDVRTWRAAMFDQHRTRESFRLSLAYSEGALVGFGWSYLGRRGQFRTDWVARTLPPERLADPWHIDAADPGDGVAARRALRRCIRW